MGVRAERTGDPERILTRAPTAELRENQTDQDSLPPYVLDQILERLVEREQPIAKIVEEGFDRETVTKVERMLNLAEYKRRQAAPGVKVTLKNFGRDRRYPIVNRFRDSGAPLPGRPLAAEGRPSGRQERPSISSGGFARRCRDPPTGGKDHRCTKRQRVSLCQPRSSARCRGHGTTRCWARAASSKPWSIRATASSTRTRSRAFCARRKRRADICTDGDAHYDEEVGGMSWQSYPLTHMDGFAELPEPMTYKIGAVAYPRGHPA